MKNSFLKVSINENNPKWEQCNKRSNTLYQRDNGIRSNFERDYTRILHSLAYRRLKHKTQVFYAPQNDHICTRMEHVSHVASVSTTIAKFLGLNVDLTQTIALGHDIGHAPFGHTGEEILNSLIQNQQTEGINQPKKFWHERNSLFFADFIETLQDPNGIEKNLNLTYAVRDGLICHCGEIDQQGLTPRNEPIDLYTIKRPGIIAPYTWEGCVVKISDKIAFLGRDMEDARSYHILDMASYRQLREIVAGTLGFGPEKENITHTNSGVHRSGRAVNTTVLINDMIVDLCQNSSPEKGLSFSEPYFKFIKELKQFSFANIYNNWRLLEFKNYATQILGCIYRTLMKLQEYAKNRRIEQALKYAPNLLKTFTDWLVKYSNYDVERKKTFRYDTLECFDVFNLESYEKCVIEYISGMTDQYAISVFHEIISF
ncbi:MAG: dNTP triphosphohydrolase [Spirochaetia bacterium]|nr:dNTP triphosphohydrolase [Spirochaetia bacterium]